MDFEKQQKLKNEIEVFPTSQRVVIHRIFQELLDHVHVLSAQMTEAPNGEKQLVSDKLEIIEKRIDDLQETVSSILSTLDVLVTRTEYSDYVSETGKKLDIINHKFDSLVRLLDNLGRSAKNIDYFATVDEHAQRETA